MIILPFIFGFLIGSMTRYLARIIIYYRTKRKIWNNIRKSIELDEYEHKNLR